MRTAPRTARGAFTKGALILIAFAAACVLVPGLFWWGTTFTRSLDDAELVESLRDDASSRQVQHAVEELSRRFVEGRPGMDRWAEDLVRVSRRPEEAVRISAAWCMQFDPERDVFVARLREMVGDPSPMVRRNAATSLARSGDPAALPVVRAMLAPFEVKAPAAGTIAGLPAIDQPVEQGSPIGTLASPGAEETVRVRAPVPGAVSEVLVDDGTQVAAGTPLLRLRPAAAHVSNALAALALVGEDADRATLRSLADPRSGHSDDVRQTATWALGALEERLREE
jgi:hypothetical protein